MDACDCMCLFTYRFPSSRMSGKEAGGDGKLIKSLTAGVDGIRYVQQQDGKIVGAGTRGGHVGLIRLNANGTLDTSFVGPSGTGNGAFVINVGTADQALGLAVHGDGKIVIVGSSDNDVLVMRLNADGSYDTAFDGPAGTGNGKFKLDYGDADGPWNQPSGAALGGRRFATRLDRVDRDGFAKLLRRRRLLLVVAAHR